MSLRLLRSAGPALALLGLAALGVRAADDAVESRMRKDVTFLASAECEGRGVGTKGIDLAADYIAGAFKQAGLKPAAPDGSYFQPFTMSGPAKLEAPNTLTLRGPEDKEITLELGKDFQAMSLSGAGKLTAPVVFAGYGVSAPKQGYDDYQGLDTAGKVVIVLRRLPGPWNKDEALTAEHAALVRKLGNAEVHKAAAVLFVSDRETAGKDDPLMNFRYAGGAGGGKLLAAHLRRSVADRLLQAALGKSLEEVEEAIDQGPKPHSAALTGWTADLELNVKRTTIPVKNVVGVLEGSGPLAKQTIVVGAHYDHLGYGGAGSLARNPNERAIHHGADDNASGTSALLELARRFGEQQAGGREGRRLVFIAFSAEESGLLGSEHYCKNPLFPLEDTAAMVNLDMVGRLRPDKETQKDQLQVYGTGTARTFNTLIDELNRKYDFKLQKIAGGMGPSDHASFYARQVPVFFFFTGDHPDYHKPSDTAEKINVPGMRRVTDLTHDLVAYLAETPERPEYVKVAGGGVSRMAAGGPRLGIRPSYGDDKEGVLLSGVSDDSPASRAGLKEGDRIVELGGKPVKSLQGYMALMATYKKGDSLDVGIVRDGKKQKLKVKLD